VRGKRANDLKEGSEPSLTYIYFSFWEGTPTFSTCPAYKISSQNDAGLSVLMMVSLQAVFFIREEVFFSFGLSF